MKIQNLIYDVMLECGNEHLPPELQISKDTDKWTVYQRAYYLKSHDELDVMLYSCLYPKIENILEKLRQMGSKAALQYDLAATDFVNYYVDELVDEFQNLAEANRFFDYYEEFDDDAEEDETGSFTVYNADFFTMMQHLEAAMRHIEDTLKKNHGR